MTPKRYAGCQAWRTKCYQDAIGYVQHYSRSHEVVIRVYDDAANMIETHEHTCDSTTP